RDRPGGILEAIKMETLLQIENITLEDIQNLVEIKKLSEQQRIYNLINEKIIQVYDKARFLFPSVQLVIPQVKYDLIGRVAGYAYNKKNLIRINYKLCAENLDDYLN